MSTVINKITNLKSSVVTSNHSINQSNKEQTKFNYGKNKVIQSKSMSNLHNSMSCLTSNNNSNATGSENFILSSQIHEISILRRALVAAREGDLQTLQLLQPILSHSNKDDGFNIVDNIVDNFGASLVHYAARNGSIKVLRFLVIKCKLSANCRSNMGALPIHDAAALGKLSALVWLVRNAQCSLMDRDKEGATVLHVASRYGRQSVVRWLVKEAKMPVMDKTNAGATPLHYSAAKGCLDCVKILVESCPELSNCQMENNVTPIYLAAQEGHVHVLRYLVQVAKGDIDIRAKDGMAPVHAASQMGQLKCVKFLVSEQNNQLNCLDNEKATPLHFASSRGKIQTVKWLLRHGARITLDKYGKSPLNDAAENEHMSVLALLLNYAQEHSYQTDCNFVNPTHHGSNFKCLPFYKALKNGSSCSSKLIHNNSSSNSSSSSCSRSCSSRKSSSSYSEYSCSDQCCLNWSSDECNSPRNEHHFKKHSTNKTKDNDCKESIFNKNCNRLNGQWMKSKCDLTNKIKGDDPKIDEQEEITMINTIKPNDSTFKKSNGTVKSITECINNGQLGDLTVDNNDQTDDSGKETASENSETVNSNKSTFDLNSSQSSSSYSTENEDCSIQKDCCSPIEKDTKLSSKNSKRDSIDRHSRNSSLTNLNEPFYLHHSTVEEKNEKLTKLFPKTNLDKLDRTNRLSNRLINSNSLPNNENGSIIETTKKFNTLDKTSRRISIDSISKIENNNLINKSDNKVDYNMNNLNKSVRIFETNKLEQKTNKIIKLTEEKLDKLDEVKLDEDSLKQVNSCSKETISIKTTLISEESTIDLKIANNDEAKDKIKADQKDESSISTDKNIPIPPPMPQNLLINEQTTTSSILIKTNKTLAVTEKKSTPNVPKITFIPPQFSSPPETDTNIKPSEYLKKVAKSYTVDNFKNMKKVKLAQQRFHKNNEDEQQYQMDSIKRSSSENHLLVNARKEKLNQSVSSNNLNNDLQEDDCLDNDSNDTDLQQLDDDTEDELLEHQYEINKPSAIELKLQLDKQLVNANLSRRSSIKVKLSANENDLDDEKRAIQQNLSSTSSTTSSSSSSNNSTINNSIASSSFGVTEEQLKTIFLKKTPIKKAETKTFSSSVSPQKNDVIAELKQSVDLEGIKKMKEQFNFRNQLNSKISELNNEFTLEKFLAKINEDQSNQQIPQWKRIMLAKKALEKARREAETNLIKEEEQKRIKAIPEWKLNLLNKKDDISSSSSNKMHLKSKFNSGNNINSEMNRSNVQIFKSSPRSIEYRSSDAKIRILNSTKINFTSNTSRSFELRKTNSVYW